VFTSSASDIALLRSLPIASNPKGFSDEGVAFFALTPTAGRCDAGARPIFRAFNNRADGNHRYSNELKLQAATVKTGFADRGRRLLLYWRQQRCLGGEARRHTLPHR
jgi:hypothetical protein